MKDSLSQQHIKRYEWKLLRFGKVRIWSGEWSMWWRPDAKGYTANIDEAGIYEAKDAWKACGHCGPEKKIRLVAV